MTYITYRTAAERKRKKKKKTTPINYTTYRRAAEFCRYSTVTFAYWIVVLFFVPLTIFLYA
jgi:hypothetical protein